MVLCYLGKIFVMLKNLDDECEVALNYAAHDDDGWCGDLGYSDRMALTSIRQENDDVQEVVAEVLP